MALLFFFLFKMMAVLAHRGEAEGADIRGYSKKRVK